MELIKLSYANGTHYCDKERLNPGSNEPYRLLIVSPAGNIHCQNGYALERLPDEIRVAALSESEILKARWEEDWKTKSVKQKYEEMIGFFKTKPFIYFLPISEDKSHCEISKMKFDYEQWINKFSDLFIRFV